MYVSVVRAQRIYDNYKWPNPIAVKLENVEPALDPPVVETQSAVIENDKAKVQGRLVKKGNASKVKVGFEFRLSAGFAENLYSKTWLQTELVEVDKEGSFSISLPALEKGKEYQYRAVVVHPQLRVRGILRSLW